MDIGNPLIYVTGEPTDDGEAAKIWHAKIESGDLNLYVGGGSPAASQALSSGGATVTYVGVRVEVVGALNGEQWTWNFSQDLDKPQVEMRYEYAQDGQLSRVSAVDQSDSEWSGYGPEKYVVEYQYDDVGWLLRKIVRDNSADDNTVRFEVDYTYNGRGQLIRERIMRYDIATERMIVTQDVQTTFDLGRNPTVVKLYDEHGWAMTETRTYAKGYQLTGFSTSEAGDVTVNTSGSFTYDTNNNLTGTKKLDASRSGTQLMVTPQLSDSNI